MTIKLSEEQMSKFGFSTQEEVIAALEKSKEKPAVLGLEGFQYRTGEMFLAHSERLKSIEASVAAFESSLKTVSLESILPEVKKVATATASAEVAAAVAKSGGAALTTKGQTDVEQPKKPAADDYGAQYDAEGAGNIRAEFPTKSSYVAYRTGIANGRIRSMSKTQTN